MSESNNRINIEEAVLATDPHEAASAAHLYYVETDSPGIVRQRCGRGFTYFDPDGNRITDPEMRERFKALAIPPAWTDVWICPTTSGHIQATGRDEKGRKQYIYHPRWEEIRNETKFNRLVIFGRTLPQLRAQLDHDLRKHGLPRERVLAAVVRLLDETLIRVGNESYARESGHYGLTTMRTNHLDINGATLQFEFTGKSGKEHQVSVRDPRAARVIRQCMEIPGHQLFQYIDEDGRRQHIDSAHVNQYLKAVMGHEFTAKEFRTWGGTVHAVHAFHELGPFETEREAEKKVVQAIKMVAEKLGNTPAVCRQYYVHPAVLEAYRDQTLLPRFHDELAGEKEESLLRPAERVVLEMLEERLSETAQALEST